MEEEDASDVEKEKNDVSQFIERITRVQKRPSKRRKTVDALIVFLVVNVSFFIVFVVLGLWSL